MKLKYWIAAAGLWAGSAGWCLAQFPEDFADEMLDTKKEPIQVSLSLRLVSVSHAHDSLQHRADYSDTTRWNWQDGSSDGAGTGMILQFRQDPGRMTLRYERITHEYSAQPAASYAHTIDTVRQDWEALYWHAREGKDAPGETGVWGWTVGIRHIAAEKTFDIREHPAVLRQQGDVSWNLLQGGYWGAWRPGGWAVQAFGSLQFMFGEVSGIARKGNDTQRDGRIHESYRNDQGLAYGMNLDIGLRAEFLQYMRLGAGYRRDWLYSFQSTESGIVVFPDNDDALFIENTTGVYAELGFVYTFP